MTIGWLGNFLILTSMVLIGKKKSLGWLLSIVGNVMWCFYGVQIQSAEIVFIDGVAILLAAYNWMKWTRNE